MFFRKMHSGRPGKAQRKSYYLKTLLDYFIFTFVILVLTFSVSTQLFLRGFERKIEESNLNLLRYVQSYTDEKIKSSTAQIISQHFIESNNSRLPDFFNPAYPLGTDTIIDSYQTIASIMQTHEYIHSIYLYRYFDDTLLSVPEGITYHALKGSRNLPVDIGGLVNEITAQSTQPVWLSPETTSAFFESNSIITYGTNLPLRFSHGKSDGIMIINLNQEKLFESVQKIYDENGFLLLLSQDDRLYSHTSMNTPVSLDDISSQIIPPMHGAEEGFFTIKLQEQSFGVVWLKSSPADWSYVYLIPLSEMTRQAMEIMKTIALIFLGVFILAIILINLITFHLHKPLRNLVSSLGTNPNIQKNAGGDDFAYMENVFAYLSGRVGEMEKTIDSNRSIIEYKALIDLLYATPHQHGGSQSSLDFFSPSFTAPRFQLLVLEIDHSVFLNLENPQREFMIIKAKEFTEDFLRGFGSGISICHPANCVVSLLNHTDHPVACQDAQALLDTLFREMGAGFNTFISGSVNSLSSISHLYDQSQRALDYHYLYNYHNVFTEEDILHEDSFNAENSQEFFDLLCGLMLANQPQQAFALLEEKAAQIRCERHSYQYVQGFCLQLSHRISQTCKQLGLQIDEEENRNLMQRFDGIRSLDDYIGWASFVIKLHLEKIEYRNASIHSDFIHRVADYVNTHIEEDITLKSVSYAFHMSSSHLSRLFKDCLNTNFQDYVFDKKLERAAWYLENEPEKNVRTISSTLGYLTPAYFSKIFKGKYGVTPSQYRKQNHLPPPDEQAPGEHP